MEQWKCKTCGEIHGKLVMDIAFQKPQHYLDVPVSERAERTWTDEEMNADLCIVDRTIYLIRAVLPISVEGGQEFRFGVWAKVDKDAFLNYHGNSWNIEEPPSFQGTLASRIPGYSLTEELGLELRFVSYKDRPTLQLHTSGHQLSVEQSEGITLTRVHEILQVCLPRLFE